MKVLHLSTYDNRGGGAISTYRLHKGLLTLGADSKLFVYHKGSDDKSVLNYRLPKGRWHKRLRKMKAKKIHDQYLSYKATIPNGFELFRHVKTENIDLVKQLPDFDIVNMHWVARFIDLASFFQEVTDRPVVWRLSDQNPITGGCHYDDECGRFLSGCHDCPQLGSNQEKDLAYQIWHEKKRIFDQVAPHRLHFIMQSNWMAELVKQSAIFKKYPVTVIPNGLDTEVFKPRDCHFARELFNLPQDKTVILFVADAITNKRKGLSYLISALEKLDNTNDVVLCAVGSEEVSDLNVTNLVRLGRVNDPRLLNLVYNMADLHIIPSIQDNLANTVIESLCCGTPVIGFPIGGNLDMIKNGENGYLCEEVSVDALYESIRKFLTNGHKFDRMKISTEAAKKYDYKVQAENVLATYTQILENFSNSKQKEITI